jgi:hypothetical protein
MRYIPFGLHGDTISGESVNTKWEIILKEDVRFVREWARRRQPIPKIGIFVVTYNVVNALAQTLKWIPLFIRNMLKKYSCSRICSFLETIICISVYFTM